MTKKENIEEPQLLGPDKLTADQIHEMPDEKRYKYLQAMTTEDLGNYFTGGMVKTLNANVQRKKRN